VIALNPNGSVLWETSVGGGVKADMTAADLTGEGPRIMVGTISGHLVILDNEGSEVNRFGMGSAISSSPVPDNFDLDEDLEIVVITMNGQLSVINPDGTNLPNFPISVGTGVVSSPAISDINHGSGPDIVFGDMSNHLHAISLSGTELPFFPIDVSRSIFSSPAITNLDDDGDLEILVGTGNSFFVIDYKTETWRNHYWNMFRGNPQRTSNYTDGFYFGVEPELTTEKPVPLEFSLAPNYPNPFNPSTTLTYSISQPTFVSLTIWNVLGQQVATLIDGHRDSGTHRVLFDASANSSGVYFARFQAGSHVQIQKMVLVR
jgi:outer membrane protein assembly factor BamB